MLIYRVNLMLVKEVIIEKTPILIENMEFIQAVSELSSSKLDALPVSDMNGAVYGIFDNQSVYSFLKSNKSEGCIIKGFVTPVYGVVSDETELTSTLEIPGNYLLVKNKEGKFYNVLSKRNIFFTRLVKLIKDMKEHISEMELMVDSVHDAIIVTNKDGIVIWANKATGRICGISKENMVGRNMHESVKSGNISKSIGLEVIRTKKECQIYQHIKSTNKYVLYTGKPIIDKDGNLTKVISTGRDLTELINLRNEIEKKEILYEHNMVQLKELKNRLAVSQLAYSSKVMDQLLQKLLKISSTDCTVLIYGESGVGKELIAEYIFNNSNRNLKPFIKVNCSNLSETLLESELFGYEEGAFSGAKKGGKIGILEATDGGTILLDEIGELPVSLQSKLLRVIQNKEIFKVGATKAKKIDVRIIAATNQNLEDLVQKGKFREDFYYRLSVMPVTVPPLKERRDDIITLALHFLKKYNSIYGKNKTLTPAALKEFYNYDWPGNVRELQNVIERIFIISDHDDITVNDVKGFLNKSNAGDVFKFDGSLTLKANVKQFERFIINKVLNKQQTIRKTAKKLGISPSTLLRKLNDSSYM
jgi:PAS domain S-box-containing protein